MSTPAPVVKTGTVEAVCTVAALFPVPSRGLVSGIDKRPIDGALKVLTHGVWGDVQGDREHHGGIFKAVYAVARETREEIARREGREGEWPDGFFGENLATSGIDTDEAVIGEVWEVGTAILEATCPRTPCGTFAHRVGDRSFPRRFTEFGKCGTYFKVLKEGEIRGGDAIRVTRRPEHGVSVSDAFRGLNADQGHALLDWAEDTGTVLYRSLVRNALAGIRAGEDAREFPESLMSDGRGN